MKVFAYAALMIAFGLGQNFAHADAYSCAKKVYAEGWLVKYDYKGQTWAAGTKKSNAVSSTVHVTTEDTTSSVDPGVTTGESVSSTQFSSSWGECSMIDTEIAQQFRHDYIAQNLHEIKKQVALGGGYHVEALAVLSGCPGVGGPAWTKNLQSHTAELYDAPTAEAFSVILDQVPTSLCQKAKVGG